MQSTSEHRKPKNPRENANPISVLFFLHLIPVFWRSFKKGFKEEDLFDVLDGHKSSLIANRLERLWNAAHKKHKKYALHLSLWKMFYKDLVLTGLIQGVKEVFVIICMPYAVGQLVSFFGNNTNTVTKTAAYLYATVIILCLFLNRVASHTVWMWLKHMSMKMRVACSSLVYRKSLRLSLEALHKTNMGHIINLLSNDGSKFDTGFVLCHYLWTAPLQAAVATYVLYRVVGIAAFAGIIFLLSFVPLQIYVGKRNSLIRLRIALRTDERVRLMNEILAGIQIIKMYTWEKPFAKLVALARRYEMKSVSLHFYIESFIFSLEMFITRTSVFITIIVFLALGNNINAEVAYAITAIYSIIRSTVTIMFSIAVALLGEAHISILRLEEFLSFPEIQSDVAKITNNLQISNSNGIIKDDITIPRVVLKNVSVKWVSDAPTDTLTDFNINVEGNQLVAVIGAVGSGKSTLLNVALKEIPVDRGNIEVNGKVSYMSQEAWIFSGSIRKNILFGDPYDEVRYHKVVKVCALESDFKILPYGDHTVVGEKGKTLSGGQKARVSLARCVYKKADIYLLDDPLSAVDTKVGKQLYNECIKGFLKDKLCILITHQLQYLQDADKVIILNNGRIVAHGTYDELQQHTLDFSNFLKKRDSDNEKDEVVSVKSYSSLDKINITWDDNNDDLEGEKEALATGSLGLTTYKDYLKKGGNWFVIFCLFLVFVATQLAGSGGDYFVSYWINLEQEASKEENANITIVDKDSIIYMYSGITLGTIIFGLAHSTVFFIFLMQASKKMHDIIFEKIVCATMSFYNNNPTGRILNRFSKDMGIVDEYIPIVLMTIADTLFFLVSSIILSCIINVWLVLPCTGLLVVLYLIRLIYIPTCRQVKRIEGITRSPIYNHTSATVNGLTTIRAYNAEKLLVEEYDNIQDTHNSAWYLYIASSEAFGLWIDTACIVFIFIVVFSFLVVNKGYYGGDVGLIITIYITLASTLQWGIFQWSEMENNMTSVERILEYGKVETEPIRPPISNIPRDWPELGKVVFDNVSMKYDINGPTVLKNLNFVVNPGEKIGIVGRTGAGKTSTISALFQFYPLSGSIIIDGVDTTKLPLDLLRSKISIIPQECVLFSGTMRKNLDPFDKYNDDVLWDALEQVKLKTVLEECPGGLSTLITESGSNFSVGQRQLICLARAIIKNNKIIVMDEATANIDSFTDSLIQKTIKNNFAHCTIITIAHRLNTIMDSDKVIVMEKGEIVEFDTPYVLLQKEKGYFQSMVQTTGTTSAKQLYTIAEEAHALKLLNTKNNTIDET